MAEVKKSILSVKMGKAVGCDDVPAVVLSNEAACKFMFQVILCVL